MGFASCDCIPFPRKLMKRKLPLVPARFIQQRNNVDTRRKVPTLEEGENHYLCCTQLKSTELQFIFYL